MGKTKVGIRVVLDTNVIISALLYRKKTSQIVDLWKSGRIILIFSEDTFNELKRVLEYPKFSLTEDEINAIIYNEVLPFVEVIEAKSKITGLCRDPDDDKFISCAISARAKFLVNRDADLISLKSHRSVKIISPLDFTKIFIENLDK